MNLTPQQRAACPIHGDRETRWAFQARYDAWMATLGPVGCPAQLVQSVACDKTNCGAPNGTPESIPGGGGATLPLPAQRRA